MRSLLVAALLLVGTTVPVAAQEASCVPECGLRVEHRLFGDRLIGADGQPIDRIATAASVQSAVRGVPLAEAWARIHAQADRRARVWGLVASVSTIALLIAESNGMSSWDESDQTSMIWGSAITGVVFGTIANRQNRISLNARGAAITAYNAAQSRR